MKKIREITLEEAKKICKSCPGCGKCPLASHDKMCLLLCPAGLDEKTLDKKIDLWWLNNV